MIIGSEIIDLSLSNLFKCWQLFRRGKIASCEIIEFEYYLEENLRRLEADLNSNNYNHGNYRQFEVIDNKRRLIKVAPVRDRVVHRLVYEYLKNIFDKKFIYDVWSCRKNKGLIGAVNRSQKFLHQCPNSYVWRSDVRKFFDNVNKSVLLDLIKRKIGDNKALDIIKEIIFSECFQCDKENKNASSIPIGNLTSQIFANIYLNELDRFVKHNLKIKFYLRYGDDFIILLDSKVELDVIRLKVKEFLIDKLGLEVNCRYDIILKVNRGLKFLGAVIYPYGKSLNRRNNKRVNKSISLRNLSSYMGLVRQYEPKKLLELDYLALDLLNDL